MIYHTIDYTVVWTCSTCIYVCVWPCIHKIDDVINKVSIPRAGHVSSPLSKVDHAYHAYHLVTYIHGTALTAMHCQ